MSKPKILLVEDDVNGGREIAASLRHDFGLAVCNPADPESLEKCLSTETFDGALIDRKLEIGPWQSVRKGKKISGVMVKNGEGVLRLARKLNGKVPAYVYSTYLSRGNSSTILIRKPINPRAGELKKTLKLLDDKTTERVRSIGSWEMSYERYKRLTFNERIQNYEKALTLNADRLKNFNYLGNVAWFLLARKKIRLCGESLSPHHDAAPFDVARAKRLDQKAITDVARASHAFPYPFWNTKPQYLEKQFELAGPNLSNFPVTVQDLFSVSVANSCAKAYLDEPDNDLLKWCSRLRNEGKTRVSKVIFKRVGGNGNRVFSRFMRNTERFSLPRIVEIYEARLDKIDLTKSAGWVELKKFGEEKISLVEPFDLKLLKDNGVKHEHQRFEYSVYRWPNGSLGMSIELSPDNNETLFSFLD